MTAPPVTASRPSPEFPGFRLVAWATATSITTVRTTKRHLAPESAFDGTGPRETLCGRMWRVSREVSPTSYWTDGACQRCRQRARAAILAAAPDDARDRVLAAIRLDGEPATADVVYRWAGMGREYVQPVLDVMVEEGTLTVADDGYRVAT